MKEHEPKVMALEAYRDDLLSAAGRARFERHLGECSVCTEHLEVMDQYAALVDEAAALDAPEINWDRFEARLDAALDEVDAEAEAPAQAPAPRETSNVRRLFWPAMVAAAAAVLFVINPGAEQGQGEQASTEQATGQPPTPAPEPEKVTGWVTLAAHDATVQRADGEPEGAKPGGPIEEGMSLRTGPESELHVRLAKDTGMVVWPDSEVTIEGLRDNGVRLTLVRGTVSNTVRKLGEGEHYEVTSGEYTTHVRGTRFAVRRIEGEVSVALFEGRVEITRAGERQAILEPGGKWTARERLVDMTDRAPHGMTESSSSWPTVALPVLPEVVTWELGDHSYSATGGLAMRQPPGPLQLGFTDTRGTRHALTIDVGTDGTELSEKAVDEVLAEAQAAREGYLSPEQITPVVRSGLAQLQRCYERSLRRDPELKGRLKLRIRVAPNGKVSRAQLKGKLPIELERCIESQAKQWSFPRPKGGPVSFDVPLNFQAKR